MHPDDSVEIESVYQTNVLTRDYEGALVIVRNRNRDRDRHRNRSIVVLQPK